MPNVSVMSVLFDAETKFKLHHVAHGTAYCALKSGITTSRDGWLVMDRYISVVSQINTLLT